MSHLKKHINNSALSRRLKNSVSHFTAGESGNMLVFGLCIFGTMVVASGMAIDFMRHENQRTALQATLDRAVLAAADMDQKLDAKEVVRDYMAKSGMSGYELNVSSDPGLVHRSVIAEANTSVQTMFLNALGIVDLDAPAQSSASEVVNNVEVSLVLDVSGSMGRTATDGAKVKIEYLREAASAFIDTILQPSSQGRISVSLVPYTGQTNVGADIMSYYTGLDRVHDYSHCVDFEDSDFESAGLSLSAPLKQTQHYEYAGYANLADTPIDNPICSDKPGDEVIAFQNDATELKARINALEPRSETGIHYAMKWAMAMLDPSFDTVVSGLIGAEKVDATFEGRPVAFDDEETTKIVVLMTDGKNVDQRRIPEARYQTEEDMQHYAMNPYWMGDQDGERFAVEKVQLAKASVNGRDSADANLMEICSVARDKGVIVFTIGYELGYDASAKAVLAQCASSDSHAYEAENIELESTFSAVARTITQLRLTK